MSVMRKCVGLYPLGIWIALLAHALLLLGWTMQAYSLADWDGAVDLGLQEARFTGSDAERAWATADRGVCAADLLWGLPVWGVAVVGLLRRRLSGFAAGMMELGLGVYFPVMFAFQKWSSHPDTALAALLLWLLPSAVGIVGLWSNRGLGWDAGLARSTRS